MPKIDINELIEAAASDCGEGVCLACGEFQDGCEPDARNYTCDSCGKNKVFGAEEAILMLG